MRSIDINLSSKRDDIIENRKRIEAERARARAELKSLDGLDAANQAMCDHPDCTNHYDPGYAGGSYDYTTCDICGGRCPAVHR